MSNLFQPATVVTTSRIEYPALVEVTEENFESLKSYFHSKHLLNDATPTIQLPSGELGLLPRDHTGLPIFIGDYVTASCARVRLFTTQYVEWN